MFGGMKYIVYDTPLGETGIIFDLLTDHAAVAHMFDISPDNILGAGHVKAADDGGIYCTGYSTTLEGVRSRGFLDSEVINRQLRKS